MDLYLLSSINKFKILLYLGIFLLVSNIVLADYGCCVGKVEENYCVVSEENDCDIISSNEKDIGGFFEGWAYFKEINNNLECLDSSDYNNLCENVCCNIGSGWRDMKLIKCREFNGEVKGNIGQSCSADLTNSGYCLNEEQSICELKYEYECDKDKFYEDKNLCEKALGDGCVVYSDVDGNVESCKAGTYQDARNGGDFKGKACKLITDCNCGSEELRCRTDEKGNAFEWEVNICDDKSDEIPCQTDEYCDIEQKKCIIDPCKKAHLTDKNEESWCDIIDPTGLKARHVKKSCFNGDEKIEPCDEFRNEVCKQNLTNGIYKARCVNNQWGDCIGKGKDDCVNYFCEWVNNKECLPKYPPGFEFWKVKTVEDAQTLTGNDKFCSVNTIEGCKRSGDCEGGSDIAKPSDGEDSVDLLIEKSYWKNEPSLYGSPNDDTNFILDYYFKADGTNYNGYSYSYAPYAFYDSGQIGYSWGYRVRSWFYIGTEQEVNFFLYGSNGFNSIYVKNVNGDIVHSEECLACTTQFSLLEGWYQISVYSYGAERTIKFYLVQNGAIWSGGDPRNFVDTYKKSWFDSFNKITSKIV